MTTHLIRHSWTGAEHAWCGALSAEEGGPEPNSEMWSEVDCEHCLEWAALFGRRAQDELARRRDQARPDQPVTCLYCPGPVERYGLCYDHLYGLSRGD